MRMIPYFVGFPLNSVNWVEANWYLKILELLGLCCFDIDIPPWNISKWYVY